MASNNFLVVGITPTNNETNVDINNPIKIKFSTYMQPDTINEANIVLRKVNGGDVDYSLSYNSTLMTATITPSSPLEYGTEYEVFISGGQESILGVTNDYLPESKIYRFTTSFNVSVSVPQALTSSVDNGYISLSWSRPAQYDVGLALTYEVQISTSNDPSQPPVWPSTGDINKTTGLLLNIPKKFSEGIYYAYVRALNTASMSDWASVQILIEAPASTPVVTNPDTGITTPTDIFSFDVVDTYPRRDDADINPERIILAFSSNVDITSLVSDGKDSVYVVKKPDKEKLSLIDFMTDYSVSKQVPAIIEADNNVVVLTTDDLEKDSEYTVIVRETVKSTSGASLGVAYHWSFITEYTTLYGDENLVRQDIGSLSDSVSDRTLYTYMNDASLYTYQVASNTSVFDAAQFVDGKAPYEVHQYVRYRTAYALLLNSQLQVSAGGSIGGGAAFTKEVKLGDLTVMQDPTSSASGSSSISTGSVITDLQDKMKIYMDMIQGHHNRGYAKPSVVVRGENIETYPDFLTRTEFKDLGE